MPTPCRGLFAIAMMAMSLLTFRPASAWGEQVIRLGGVRNVTATVAESNGAYRIAIEMLPVKAFDPATNKVLNLSKGRMYAAQALAKHLKAGSLTIRGLEVRESGIKSGSFHLLAVVPHDGVSRETSKPGKPHSTASSKTRPPVEPETLPQTASSQQEIHLTADAAVTDFLNRKSDYLDTIVRLQESLSEEGNSLARESLKPDDFYDSIGSVEERTEAAFKAIARQVDDDKLLLSVEQEELHPALKKAHTEVLVSLKAAVARFDQRQEKTKKAKEKKK